MLALTVILCLVALARSQSCGSLMTYRQYSVLLSGAPSCFKGGCGRPPPADSMSSECSVSQPCSHLWDFLRQEWQDDWCSPCSGDIACRISGWPILNMTAACATEPREWLFSNVGACCVSGDEPFQLADWIGGLCNGSEWRHPFDYYGGMAKEDWEEWIEPWNWTVRAENTSTQTFAQPACSPPSETLVTFAIENIVSAGGIIFGLAFFWFATYWGHTERWATWHCGLPEEKTLAKAVVSGIWYPLFHGLLASFLAAAQWRLTPGYQNVPIGYVALLLCSRPNVLMLLTSVFLAIDRLFPAPDDHHAHRDPGQEPPTINMLGRLRAKQLLSSLGLSVSISEFVTQGLGYYSIIKTTDSGVKKGFFIAGNLIPFWHGSEAMLMYAGALAHSVLAPLTVASLARSAYLHTKESKFRMRMFSYLRPFLRPAEQHLAPLLLRKRERRQERRRQREQELQRRRQQQQQQQQDPEQAENAGEGPVRVRWLMAVVETLGFHRRNPRARVGQPANRQQGKEQQLQQQQQQEEEEEQEGEHWGVYYSVVLYVFIWLERGVPTDMRAAYPSLRAAAEDRYGRPDDDTPSGAGWILAFATVCAVFNYTAQWCFWSGFVESQGPRFCPPEDDGKLGKVRAILTALTLLGILLNAWFSAVDSLPGGGGG